MAFLNWREYPHSIEIQEVKGAVRAKQVLRLSLSSESRNELVAALDELFGEELDVNAVYAPELRLSLPNQWIFFFKRRPSDSLLLIAHPEKDEWVATIALTQNHFQMLRSGLEFKTEKEVRLLDLFPVGAVSNLDLVFTLLNQSY